MSDLLPPERPTSPEQPDPTGQNGSTEPAAPPEPTQPSEPTQPASTPQQYAPEVPRVPTGQPVQYAPPTPQYAAPLSSGSGVPPELAFAETTEGPRPKKYRGLIIGLVAIVAAVALLGYGLLPLFQSVGQSEPQIERAPLPETPAGTIEGFGAQEPEWIDCGDGLQCTEVYAPLDWADTEGDRITLSLVKQSATGPETLGTLFVNPGGPGASGLQFLAGGASSAVSAELQESYDIVAWDPRGVGKSTPVECLDAAGMDDYLFGLSDVDDLEPGSDEWLAEAEAESAEFGAACAEATGPLLAHVGTAETVQDLDMLRAIVGDKQLNYLGYSYGTFIGALYAERYPENVGKLVLDGAMDPSTTLTDVVREQTRGFEAALRAYVTDCLTREECPLSGSVDDAMSQVSGLLDQVEEDPIAGSDGRMLSTSTMLTAIITPLYSQSSWPLLDDLFAEIEAGNPTTAFYLADFYFDRENGAYTTNSNEAFSAINCLDYPNDVDPARMRKEATELENIAPTIGRFQGFGDVFCGSWPHPGVDERSQVTAAGAAPILVVGTTGDPATPYRWAEALADQLESGQLLTFEGEGHTAYGESSCIVDVVDTYFLTGEVPADDPMCTQ